MDVFDDDADEKYGVEEDSDDDRRSEYQFQWPANRYPIIQRISPSNLLSYP